MGYMDIFIAWWAVGTLSAMWAAWHAGELVQGYNWMYCVIAGLSGPLFWTKRLRALAAVVKTATADRRGRKSSDVPRLSAHSRIPLASHPDRSRRDTLHWPLRSRMYRAICSIESKLSGERSLART